MLVSAELEDGTPLILARGGVARVDADGLTVATRGGLAAPCPASGIRVDGDGGATTSRAARSALAELFAAENARLVSLAVDRAAPGFDEAAGAARLERVFDERAAAAGAPRWGGSGCAADALAEDFQKLNPEQRQAVRRVFAAEDYALVREGGVEKSLFLGESKSLLLRRETKPVSADVRGDARAALPSRLAKRSATKRHLAGPRDARRRQDRDGGLLDSSARRERRARDRAEILLVGPGFATSFKRTTPACANAAKTSGNGARAAA